MFTVPQLPVAGWPDGMAVAREGAEGASGRPRGQGRGGV